MPHMGNRVPLGIVRTASTYLNKVQEINNKFLMQQNYFSIADQHCEQNAVPAVPLTRLDHLCGSIIVRDVQPQAVGHSSWGTLPKAEWVSTDEIRTFAVGVVQGVKEKRGGRAEEVLDVLLESIDVLARWVLGNLFTKTNERLL